MPNSSRSPDERNPYRALSMIWLGKTSSCAKRSTDRKSASVRVPVLVGATLAVLIIAAIELHPVKPAPADRGHPSCEWRDCE